MKRIALGVLVMAVGLGVGQSEPGGSGPSERFLKLVPAPGTVRKLSSGNGFVEGPTWLAGPPAAGLVFSDIPKSQQQLLVPDGKGGATTRPFRAESYSANGTTLDGQGRLIVCQQRTRSIVRLEKDGSLTTLADKFDGKRFNSTNDVVVARDGAVIFSDPTYGPAKKSELEMDHSGVYRVDEKGQVTELVKEMTQPNGVALSPDDSVLYVSDTGSKPSVIRAYRYVEGKVSEGRVFYEMPKGAGVSDGMRVDTEGNIWTSAGDGVRVISPAGELIGVIKVPESPANVAFGGQSGTTLFMTARTGVYSVETTARACR